MQNRHRTGGLHDWRQYFSHGDNGRTEARGVRGNEVATRGEDTGQRSAKDVDDSLCFPRQYEEPANANFGGDGGCGNV